MAGRNWYVVNIKKLRQLQETISQIKNYERFKQTYGKDIPKEVQDILDIISYVDKAGAEIPKEYLDEDTLDLLESEHYSRMVLSLKTDYEGKETFELVEKIRNIANKYYPDEYLLAGEGVSTYDLMDTISADQLKVNLVAIFAVYFVMVILQKDFLMPAALVISIESAIWINFSIPYYMGSYIFYIAYLIVSSIQLGATVDYAILLTTRYKKERIAGNDKQTSITVALKTAFPSVIVSGLGLFSATFGVALYSDIDIIGSMCMLMARGAIISMLCVLFILPALIMLLDKVIVATTIDMKICKEIN